MKGSNEEDLTGERKKTTQRRGGFAGTKKSAGMPLRIEFAPFGQGADAVGGAEGKRHDSHRGLAAAGSDKAAAIAEDKMFYVVRLVIGIDDGSFGIFAHAAGAEQVHAELLLVDRESPFLFRVGGIKQFHRAIREPVRQFQIVGMIFISEAKRGKPPGVFHVRIDGEAVVFHGQRSAVAVNFKSARPIVRERRLEIFSPAWRAGRKTADAKSNRRQVKAGIQAAATVKADFLRVEFIKIVQDAADCVALVVVGLLFEKTERNGSGVEHQFFATAPAEIGWA